MGSLGYIRYARPAALYEYFTKSGVRFHQACP
jgi:hypothetical protein